MAPPQRPNIWLGVSVEDAKNAVRLKHLQAAKASIKFVSFEPLLGPVGTIDLTGIDWAIVGGESGPRARPMGGRLGDRNSRPMLRREGRILLQTMGRHPEERSGAFPRRQNSRRLPIGLSSPAIVA